MGGDGQRVEPWLLHHVKRVQRWQYGAVSHWACRYVTLGRLPDGRWMVEHSDVTVGARAWADEQRARRAAARLTAGEGWCEVPAEYDAAGRPTGPGWYRSGGAWLRRDPSQDAPEDR